MEEDKECIDYALHAYDIFWDYYKKTLDERNQIINNYMIFIGLPISLIAIFIENITDKITFFSGHFILFLLMFFILGIVIYNTYIIESYVSERYLNQLKHITNYLIQNYDEKYKNVFKETYNLQHLFLDNKNSLNQRTNKCFIIFIINTTILIYLFCFIFNSFNSWNTLFIPFVSSVLIHLTFYIYNKSKL